MTKTATFFLLTLMAVGYTITGQAQAITTLSQNFDVACVLDSDFPTDWQRFNPLIGTTPDGQWHCTSQYGRPRTDGVATPGLMCSGYYSGDFHVDTSYIILPKMNLTSYGASQRVYLQFDAKTSLVSNGSDLSAFISKFETPVDTDTVIDHAGVSPDLYGPSDTAWGTYKMDITHFKEKGDFFLGFRYVSTSGHGSVWYLDNMNLITGPNSVPHVANDALPVSITGQPTRTEIEVTYEAKAGVAYQLTIYDMTGRVVRHETMTAASGSTRYKIAGLNLAGGIYCIRIGNDTQYGVAKAMVE